MSDNEQYEVSGPDLSGYWNVVGKTWRGNVHHTRKMPGEFPTEEQAKEEVARLSAR